MSKDSREQAVNYAIVGAGFIFDRHVAAIKATGGVVKMVCDTDKEKINKLDGDIQFFDDFYKMLQSTDFYKIDIIVICTPNRFHFEQTAEAMMAGKDVICEKPCVIDINDLQKLKDVELQTGKTVYFVHQLRESKRLADLKAELLRNPDHKSVNLKLHMHRGEFYWKGWKGTEDQSGGILFNIGVHYFDMLIWFFGYPKSYEVERSVRRANGTIEFENATVDWEINLLAGKDCQYRTLNINGEKINLTGDMESLHRKVYESCLLGVGTRIGDAKPTINFIHEMTYGKE